MRWELATHPFAVGSAPIAVVVRKAGFFEENLCRHGRVRVSDHPAKETEPKPVEVPVVQPNNPYVLNFTMQPAVSLYGQILRGKGPDAVRGGQEIGGLEVHYRGCLVGRFQFLPDGGFRLDDLPCGSLVFIGRNSSIIGQTQVGTINCDRPGRYTIVVKSSLAQQPVNSVEVIGFVPSTGPAEDKP